MQSQPPETSCAVTQPPRPPFGTYAHLLTRRHVVTGTADAAARAPDGSFCRPASRSRSAAVCSAPIRCAPRIFAVLAPVRDRASMIEILPHALALSIAAGSIDLS